MTPKRIRGLVAGLAVAGIMAACEPVPPAPSLPIPSFTYTLDHATVLGMANVIQRYPNTSSALTGGVAAAAGAACSPLGVAGAAVCAAAAGFAGAVFLDRVVWASVIVHCVDIHYYPGPFGPVVTGFSDRACPRAGAPAPGYPVGNTGPPPGGGGGGGSW